MTETCNLVQVTAVQNFSIDRSQNEGANYFKYVVLRQLSILYQI